MNSELIRLMPRMFEYIVFIEVVEVRKLANLLRFRYSCILICLEKWVWILGIDTGLKAGGKGCPKFEIVLPSQMSIRI